jgi:hypothetical protein
MGFKGSLSELQLTALVEMISLGEKSVSVALYDLLGSCVGALTFHDGSLTAAACGRLRGEKAFYALFSIEEGSFLVETIPSAGNESPRLATPPLLMEAMRRLDETSRLRSTLTPSARARAVAGADAQDDMEANVINAVGDGERRVSEITHLVMDTSTADEHDVLSAVERLLHRRCISLDVGATSSQP